MKNIVFLLFLALFGFVVAGWFLDWYRIADLRGDSGRHRVQIEIDSDKIKKDWDRGVEKGWDAWRRAQHTSEPQSLPEQIISMPSER